MTLYAAGAGVAPAISALQFPKEPPATRLRPSPAAESRNGTHRITTGEPEFVMYYKRHKIIRQALFSVFFQ